MGPPPATKLRGALRLLVLSLGEAHEFVQPAVKVARDWVPLLPPNSEVRLLVLPLGEAHQFVQRMVDAARKCGPTFCPFDGICRCRCQIWEPGLVQLCVPVPGMWEGHLPRSKKRMLAFEDHTWWKLARWSHERVRCLLRQEGLPD